MKFIVLHEPIGVLSPREFFGLTIFFFQIFKFLVVDWPADKLSSLAPTATPSLLTTENGELLKAAKGIS